MTEYRDEVDPWYHKARWKRRKRHQLKVHPLCKMCLDRGVVNPATVVDHVIPHKGNFNAFFLGDLQSLCKDHHDGAKQWEEKRGYARDIGEDGFPIDRRHPFNKQASEKTRAVRYEAFCPTTSTRQRGKMDER
jgi:hypothetical protein